VRRIVRALARVVLLSATVPRTARAVGLEKEAAGGSETALVAVASRLELGIGQSADPARLMALFCRAALLGDCGALLHIADWLHRLRRAERGAPQIGPPPCCTWAAPTGLPSMAVALRRLIEHRAPEYGLDPDLTKAVVEVESSYRVDAVSPAGAAGLMQLMPASANALAAKDNMDAEQNLSGGMRAHAALIGRYHSDLSLALAAYNAGEAAVDSCRCVPAIPESHRYVERVLALFRGAENRAARALGTGAAIPEAHLRMLAAEGR
jgi:soluble lytic murein transglycosylase-like protein